MARRGLVALLLVLLTASAASARTQRTFVIEGRGWGHGVGMSQWGAEGFAIHGWSYRAILAHYYPGTTLEGVQGRTVRVLLAESLPRVRISSRSAFRMTWRGRTRVRGAPVVVTPRTGPIFSMPGGNPLSVAGNGYRGELRLFPNAGGVAVVNVVSLERYLRGVVPWEMPFHWRPQALAAVAARSYTLATLHPKQGFDVFADTRDQEYGGIRAETDATNRAVGATAGQVLSYGGRVALAYYSSTSGGQTAAGGRPYLASVSDPYDAISPHHRWGPLRFTARGLARRLHVPGVVKLTPLLNSSGRVASVRIGWAHGGTTLPASTVQSRLGLPSLWFWVGGSAPRGTLATPASDWPAGRAAWTVVLQAVPESAGAGAAKAVEEKARRAGLPRVGVLVSDGYPSLRPGYRVVFSGVYGSPTAAQEAARAAARVYPQAYARRVG